MSTALRFLSFAVPPGDEPPREFRIFSAGVNETSKGAFLFDGPAAALVLAAYRDQGNELMVDYEHAALGSTNAPDPAQAGKAAAWFDLELRNGELWAVNVRWTPPAADALRRKEWRYMSPAFHSDESGRIVDLLNVALTNLPATKRLQPLMAASELYSEGGVMTPEQLAQLADILGMGSDAMVEDVLAAVAAVVKKIADASGGNAPEPNDSGDTEPDPSDPNEPAEMAPPAAAMQAAAARLLRLASKSDVGEALAEVEAWRKSHLELTAGQAKLAAEQAALESSERMRLVAQLVQCGAEIPATAWANDDAKEPCARLAAEPLAGLRSRVAMLSGARGKGVAPKPPTASSQGMTDKEIQKCKAKGIDPAKYAETRARIAARNARQPAQES